MILNLCFCDNSLGFYLDNTNTACVACNLIVSNCIDCQTVSSVTNCINCAPTYYLSGGSCLACSTLCATCTTISSCDTCIGSFVLLSGLCGCDNSAGLYIDNLGTSCLSCSTIYTNCITCSTVSSTTNCIDCTTGFYLSSNTCLSCPTLCTTCTASLSWFNSKSIFRLYNDNLCSV